MTTFGTPPEVIGSGEYGATTVQLSGDGDAVRLAFGRNAPHGGKVFYGAVLLTREAVAELRTQLDAME